ncbi:MAG TPA: AgmX/PglI C-terminal domain-containing protein [Anaeromyxobacter sp.]|nr:AgmX/PglI C-terminal domain-containing protein [Anaeromyxobacter sp.]
MALTPDGLPLLDDPELAGGEWLFRRGGEVFGPVDSRALALLLYRGEVDGGTPISAGDGRWRPAAEVDLFRLHVRKAVAALRVEREVTGARRLRRRRRRRITAAVVALAVAVVAGAALAARLMASGGGVVSPLLEDFGQGIRVASSRVVAGGGRGADDVEVELSPAPAAEGAPGPRRAERAARPASRGAAPPAAAGEGELVAAQFDVGRIQAMVNREQRTLVPCFREEAARTADFRGEVPLEFAIGNDGRVAALWIDEPSLREGPLRECLLRALAAWRFDPFPGQRPTVVLSFAVGR